MISIVIPAYNCALYVEATYQSVLGQTETEWELIFVNDGSTDQTAEILNQIQSADPRVRVIHQVNGRQGKARNAGLHIAQGDWIAFIDADDIWPPDKLKEQLSRTIEAGADMSFTNGYICLNNNMQLREHLFGVEDKLYQGESAVQEFHLQNRVPTSSVLISKSVLLESGGFPEELEIQNCEDYLLWVNLLVLGKKLLGISKPLLYYRVYPDSSTGQELKLLFPLLKALHRMPGKRGEAWEQHLSLIFRKFIFRLNENGRLKEAGALIPQTLPYLYPSLMRFFLSASWRVSPSLFIRLFWRLTKGKLVD